MNFHIYTQTHFTIDFLIFDFAVATHYNGIFVYRFHFYGGQFQFTTVISLIIVVALLRYNTQIAEHI